MENKNHAFLIAAPSSNSGKTTLTLGLMNALKNQGLLVQPFKCGPDFIDPMYHKAVTGKESYNLDCQMADEKHVISVFKKHASAANVSIVEGVMGLFDGAMKDHASSAHIAKLLKIPVILVVDAKSMAYSAAALLYGFKNFSSDINVAGVIFNKVGSASHYSFLKDAAIDVGVTPLGYIERKAQLATPSRHLGLSLPHENNLNATLLELQESILKNIDLQKLLEISQVSIDYGNQNHKITNTHKRIKIAIAFDDAFNFMYPANIDALNIFGDIKYFSPLNDDHIPHADLIWLPGGYPELFAEKLSNNKKMHKAISEHVNSGKALMAECGGFIYLGKNIETENKIFEMVNVFEHCTSMVNAKLTLGYRSAQITDTVFMGHEFHYSNLCVTPKSDNYVVKNARKAVVEMPIYKKNNSLASYMHFYCGEPHKMKELLNLLSINI